MGKSVQHHVIPASETYPKPITFDVCWEGDGPLPLLLFVHGFKGFKDWGTFPMVANSFAAQGFMFLKMNFSHNGTTPKTLLDFTDLEAFGQNNFGTELEDIGRVLDTLALSDLPYDPSKIGIIGHSRGGSIALIKAAEDERIKAVATWAAVADLVGRYAPEDKAAAWEQTGVDYVLNGRTEQQMPLYFQLFTDTRQHAQRYDVCAAATRLQKPLLVVHGTADAAVSPDEARAIVQSYGEPAALCLIPEADHVFGGSHPYSGVSLPAYLEQVCVETSVFFEKNSLL